MAFPTTSVLDAFTDASAPRNLSAYDSTNWALLSARTGTELQTTGTTVNSTAGTDHADYRKTISAADLEVYVTLPVALASSNLRLYARVQNPTNGSTWNAYECIFLLGGSSDLRKVVTSTESSLGASMTTQVISAGDSVGLSVIGTVVTAWYKAAAGSWVSLGSISDSSVTGAGTIAASLNDSSATLDNFGGGKPPVAASLTDTGLSISSSLATTRVRALTDTGLITTTLPFPGESVLDTFTDASAPRNLSAYSGNWAAMSGYQADENRTTVSHTVEASASNDGSDYWTSLMPADQVVFSDVPTGVAFNKVELWGRVQNPTNGATINAYRLQYVSGNLIQIRALINGSPSGAIVSTSQALSAGDSWGMSMVGTTITAWYKASGSGTWVNIGSATDSSVVGAGYIGLGVEDSAATLDNFGGGAVGKTLVDSIARGSVRALTDTGLSISSSLSLSRARSLVDTGLSISSSLVTHHLRTVSLVDAGLVVSDSLARGPVTEEYHITIQVPYVEGDYISAGLLDFLAEITPAHLDYSVGFSNGFLVGISEVGIDAL